jgi:hypothetical protein
MRIEMIAVGALLVSPLLLCQQFTPSAGRGQIDELLYQQAVSDHGVSAGLVTNSRGVNFRAHMAVMLNCIEEQ